MVRGLIVAAVMTMIASAAWAADGEQIYNQKCKACHSIGGVGGPMAKTGGALDDVGAKHDGDWLHAYLKDPKSKIPNAKMPKMNLSDADADAVVQYLLTLKGGAK
jgi:mono/diheme cytochrome c family protein